MSRRKRQIEKQKKEIAKQKVRAAKQARQKNSTNITWEEKKRRKRQAQEAYKEGKFPGIHNECELETFQLPSPERCKDCVLDCRYNK